MGAEIQSFGREREETRWQEENKTLQKTLRFRMVQEREKKRSKSRILGSPRLIGF